MNRLRELRKEKGLTQKELGKVANVSDRSVGFYESGERDPDTETVKIFADYFDVSIDYLLGRTTKRQYDTDTIAFHTVSVDGLDDDDIALVENLVESLMKKHEKKREK